MSREVTTLLPRACAWLSLSQATVSPRWPAAYDGIKDCCDRVARSREDRGARTLCVRAHLAVCHPRVCGLWNSSSLTG